MLQILTAAALVWALIAITPGDRAMPGALLWAMVVAVSLESILAGAALDQVIVHLPARRKISERAWAGYVRATDGRAGWVVYPIVGLSSNIATLGAMLSPWH